ncbi:response regulator [candidate division KSB3 bacterium]|uniref:Response regulator n=1 Tax=candidate division KSB3 bacterium TaxID=2044937 RepID=A0A9D5JVI9_9BACT|nr:response regulator [candidate division KSB3 bacterium]MBD3324918.1 response regulator [candidate division KSB3 bacterium]
MEEKHVILVVDDEESSRESVERMLREEHYTVLCAENGEQALQLLHQHPHVDLILTDMRMPGMSGLDLLKKVRTIHENIRVIIVTGFGEIESYIEAMSSGAVEYVSKPFKMNELKLIVKKVLNNPEES